MGRWLRWSGAVLLRAGTGLRLRLLRGLDLRRLRWLRLLT